MQIRLWQLLVLVPLFSTQLTVQSLAEELPGKPENKTKGIPYAAHPEVQHHSKTKDGADHHRTSTSSQATFEHEYSIRKVKQAAGQSKSEGSAKTEGADKTESKATKP
jgi:hypothetical protein